MKTEKATLGRREFLNAAAWGLGIGSAWPLRLEGTTRLPKFPLTAEHGAAVNRRRRVVVSFDAIHGDIAFSRVKPEKLVKLSHTFADEEGSYIDSIWWNWHESDRSPYPSEVLPPLNHPDYRRWISEGVNIMRIFLAGTHARGLEAFHSFRMNGSDNDLTPTSSWPAEEREKYQDLSRQIPLKEAHPEWLLPQLPWGPRPWNYAVPEVQDYRLRTLSEIAEYDFDGIELDFSQFGVLFPLGQQWEHREHLTKFMRAVRSMTLEVERKRGRPFLLAAKVPENLEGCHLDGLDVETWAAEQLVDIFVMGCRSFDVDVRAFRRITAGINIKLYASIDGHHSTDGYNWPPIEVLRGVFANWWHQGVDGIQTFNWNYALHEDALRAGVFGAPHFKQPGPVHQQAYREMGDPEVLRPKNKTFVIHRRGGGHGPSVIPNPEDWHTPRFYSNTNMLAPLPALLANDGKADTLLKLYVADDLTAVARKLQELRLRLLIHDPVAGDHLETREPMMPVQPDGERIERAVVRPWRDDNFLWNAPAKMGIEKRIEMRLNNSLLEEPVLEGGWLIFRPDPRQYAVGDNLIGIRVTGRDGQGQPEMLIEKLELQVSYTSVVGEEG